jgi:hypothetical protein
VSHLVAPDPFPGRCKNHRSDFRYGRLVSLRCLDYEGTQHVCTFEELRPPFTASDQVTSSLHPSNPEPWVKPPAAPTGGK